MIVRISGTGQFELDDNGVHELDKLDTELTNAYQAGDAEGFKAALARTVAYIRDNGKQVPDDSVLPSEVIVPPDDINIEEAGDYMTDEGLMQPLEA